MTRGQAGQFPLWSPPAEGRGGGAAEGGRPSMACSSVPSPASTLRSCAWVTCGYRRFRANKRTKDWVSLGP